MREPVCWWRGVWRAVGGLQGLPNVTSGDADRRKLVSFWLLNDAPSTFFKLDFRRLEAHLNAQRLPR